MEDIVSLPVRERIGRFKAVPYANFEAEAQSVMAQMTEELNRLISAAGQN